MAKKFQELRDKMRRRERTDEEALAEERGRVAAVGQRVERERVVKALQKEVKVLESRQAFIDEISSAPDPEPLVIKALKGQGKTLPAATYVMLASDWHVGERVRPENVGGRNEYTPEIAQERALRYWKSQLIMLNAARAAWDVRWAVLWLGGDLMTGYIHEEYLEENFLSPVEEALLLHRMLLPGIRAFMDESGLERLLVPTSCGNHGRTGQKMKVSTAAKNSFEWLAYQHLAFALDGDDRIKFQVGTGYHNVVDVYGFRIRFHHGDGLSYQGGIGGLSIPANRRIGRQALSIPLEWEGTIRGVTHLDAFGHYHQLSYPKYFISNGSLIGWNDFAEKIGCSFEPPQQCSFVVDERYRVVSNFNPILVTSRGKK